MQEADRDSAENARITLTPGMRPVAPGSDSATTPIAMAPGGRNSRLSILFGTVGLLAGLAGLAASVFVYTESQREAHRLATEIAQLRVGLDLYARNAGNAGDTDDSALSEISDRLAILEQNWRDNSTVATPVPEPSAPAPAAIANAGANADCLPSGMRILVAQGDSYPVCDQPASVNVGQVANGYIVLLDGTTIASGGSMPLPGTPCTIGVTSGGDEGLTGYAEIRVTC